MIESPQNLSEQLQNFSERVATEMRAIYNKLKTAVFTINGLGPDDNGNIAITSVANADTATTATTATKAAQDGNGNNIASTYLSKTDAATTYLGKTDKAASATTADTATSATTATTATNAASATKATQDADGNNISQTYLKQTDASSTYLSKTDAASTYLGKTDKAASATTADSATTAETATKAIQDSSGNNIEDTYAKKTDIPDVPEVDTSALVLKRGARGLMAGYEQVAYAEDYVVDGVLTLSQDMPDSLLCADEVQINLTSQDIYEITWIKIIACSVQPTAIYLSGYWGWANEQIPTIEGPGLLVAHWIHGAGGTVNYIPQYGADTSGTVS